MSERFVLRYRGQSRPPTDEVKRIESVKGLKVLEKFGRMILVDAEPEALLPVSDDLKNWIVVPEETSVALPDPKSEIRITKKSEG